uniref:Lysozyme n=1 Tax=Panagrolaimus sp. JU765 TaxID=591449 RepID=A0AC34R819_9BILA
MRIFIFLLACIGSSYGTIGWDGIQAVSVSGFQCLYNNGYRFFIARVWESVGNYDYTGIQNIKNARAAGWEYVDGYIFPCLRSTCASAKAQVEATVNKLKAEGAKFGMIWLDIERLAWPADKNHNRQFISDMMNQLAAMGVNYGIYTNYNNWEAIVGADWTGGSSRPLWWATYNGHQDYTGFSPFGGWSKPAIHQYSGSVNGPCGVNMDQNWYP